MNNNAANNNVFPSNLKNLLVLLGATLLLIVVSIFIGALASFIGSIFGIVLVFPFVMGVACSSLLRDVVKRGWVRKTSHITALAVLMAVTTYGTYHFVRYVMFEGLAIADAMAELRSAHLEDPLKAATVVVDYSLKEATGHSGFLGYMLYKAQQGISIGHWYSSSGLNLGPLFTWLYWLVEFGIILWVILSAVKKERPVPVCECCGSRYGREKHLGGASLDQKSTLLELIERREFLELGKRLGMTTDIPSLEFYMKNCTGCENSTSQMTVQHAFKGPKGRLQFIDLLNVSLQPQERRLLFQELKAE